MILEVTLQLLSLFSRFIQIPIYNFMWNIFIFVGLKFILMLKNTSNRTISYSAGWVSASKGVFSIAHHFLAFPIASAGLVPVKAYFLVVLGSCLWNIIIFQLIKPLIRSFKTKSIFIIIKIILYIFTLPCSKLEWKYLADIGWIYLPPLPDKYMTAKDVNCYNTRLKFSQEASKYRDILEVYRCPPLSLYVC